jgi:hypothetical protein|tara:strand:+ start:1625 stop:2221 length:597 start_codon:yes stop_codon:yes gene_type:complete
VTDRKKNILIIQILIFIVGVLIIYFTYLNKDSNQKVETVQKIKQKENDEKKTDLDSNTFENVEYKGVDLRGNRYTIKSEVADFKVENPELINMKVMSAVFYFKDGTILRVRGDYGTYNNKTNDMNFRENIKVTYKEDALFSDNLDFLNSKNYLKIYGNVRAESIKGNIKADNLEFDLLKQTLDISMFNNGQINMVLSN